MKYGEFVDAMREVSKINIEAEMLFEEWYGMAGEEQWKEYYDLPLGKGEVQNFAEDMASFFWRVIMETDGEELYVMRMQDGHAFLQAIHKKCVELGIDIDGVQIDAPLSPSDAIIRGQYPSLNEGD
ncbi:MAG: hypothetical protein A2998_01980 [Candidatus Staskawiczbacteria bacterium RIFCSPLOWO2_01_FULL_37_25b]|uniref:Uncharacterized protein n=2 Tax=Candidatus Staskawicziibacteriota TaxID=1817916 RepID=A0A1G2HPY1_9BACT|nr:MAG: hypothetical protein A2812_03255 [Candidatus Staskawiczbacteria bacterium RIFCSPHIGHO2_01_FULL_36_16]OGZ73467.1 MAG: hypothetical protein A2998_01980 [Candidatus Staskawiczbacteria bacterium RIFCSPLOWO2_01_FULL_37_25b]